MSVRPLLIVSNTLSASALYESPFGLTPEDVSLTGFQSLRFVSLKSYRAVVLHEPPAETLRKLALGIRDTAELEGLWSLLNHQPVIPVRLLVPTVVRPGKDAADLGFETMIPKQLKELVREISGSAGSPSVGSVPGSLRASPGTTLTADDIRERHQKGQDSISEDQPMTPWAREVATALGMQFTATGRGHLLVRLPAKSRQELKRMGERAMALSQRNPEALFVLPTPLIPIFHDLYPTLKSRVVSPTVHWATHGAFTGEIPLEMLLDFGCAGAIYPTQAVYHRPEHLKTLTGRLKGRNFVFFLPETLAPEIRCDIMAQLSAGTGAASPALLLRDGRGKPMKATETEIATLIDISDWQ